MKNYFEGPLRNKSSVQQISFCANKKHLSSEPVSEPKNQKDSSLVAEEQLQYRTELQRTGMVRTFPIVFWEV